MSAKSKVVYMHTIEDQPAYFSEHDGQIVYADRGRSNRAATLVESTRQIHREQQKTIANRRAWGFKGGAGRYGYVRVRLP